MPEPHVQRNAADALGKIKSEDAVEHLIRALKDENENENADVRISAIWALGEIKPDESVEHLIRALKDKDIYVRRNATDALYKIKSSEAVGPLKKALDDQNDAVSNISCYLLKKIKRIERSEEKILLNKVKNSEKVDSDNLDNQELPCGKPPEDGFTDSYFSIFVNKLISIKYPTSIVDYGCGQGKLLCALKNLNDAQLNNISYFGVDEKTQCRYISRLTAKKHGFFNLFREKPEFLNPKNFYAKNVRLDYAFLMHTLHEIKLINLIEIIYSISTKLKINGKIFILDQRKLTEKERDFVLWDKKEYFYTLFLNSGFEVSHIDFNTKSGNKLSLIEVEKFNDCCFSKEKVGENCLKVYETKKIMVSNMLDNKEISDDKHMHLNDLYTYVDRQINDLKRNYHD